MECDLWDEMRRSQSPKDEMRMRQKMCPVNKPARRLIEMGESGGVMGQALWFSSDQVRINELKVLLCRAAVQVKVAI